MSWRSSNEGSACDAVLRHIEGRTGASRGNLRRPEREGHAAPIELLCELGGELLAIEHTAVEAFAGQIENDVNFERQMAPITQLLNPHVPADEHWDIIIPVDALREIKPRQFAAMHTAIAQSILAAALKAKAAPWGAIHFPTTLGVDEGCPIALRFRRFRLANFSHKFLQGAHITRSVGPLEAPRTERMRKVCDDKLPKLAAWRAQGARTVLILESNDFVITSPEAVAEAYLEAEVGRDDRPDEVYFVWALDDASATSKWYLSLVREGDRTGRALWETGPNLFEIDPRELQDLTAR